MITSIISIAAVFLLILTGLAVIFRRYNRLSHISFFIGMVSTAVAISGDAVVISVPDALITWKGIVFMAEAVMVTSFLLFSISFARADYWRAGSKFAKFLLFLSPLFVYIFITIPINSFFYSPEFETEKTLFLENPGYIFNLLLLLYSIMTIINLEATLRGSAGINKWRLKYALMGVGGIVAMNIFYYSYALLYRAINMNLIPVKCGVVLVSILLVNFSIIKHKAMDLEITISRKVLYKSFALFIIGSYLLGLGIIGEGMRYFGPQLGENITTFMGFVGAILLLTILLSEQLRKKAIVFINKHFYHQKYDYREQWLQFTQRISLKHSFQELIESITEGFKQAMGSRGASIWLRDKGSSGFRCYFGLRPNTGNVSPDMELLLFLQSRRWVFNINDPRCNGVVKLNREFIENTQVELVVPLLHADDLIGFIILMRGFTDSDYNFEDYDLLKTLAKQATLAIMNAQLTEALTEAKEVEAMGRISAFVLHDLKNAASMLSLIAQNAEEHIDNPDFQKDAIRSVSNTTKEINNIIAKLKDLPAKNKLKFEYTDLANCVKSAVQQLNLNGNSKLTLIVKEQVPTMVDKEGIIKVMINLIMNAFDAVDERGEIFVSVGRENDMGLIVVSDTGCGMTADFIEKRLFKPFQTTKGKGLGIGLYQSKGIVEAHSGKLTVESTCGKGTDFKVYLPIVSNI